MIGREFARRAAAPADYPEHVRVVGQIGSDWSCQPVDVHGATFALSPTDLANFYGAPPEIPVEVNEESARAPSAAELHEALTGYRHINGPDTPADGASPSPENVFAAAADAAAQAEE